jgi:hypothetical protein
MLSKNPENRLTPTECVEFFSTFTSAEKHPWILSKRTKNNIRYRMEHDFAEAPDFEDLPKSDSDYMLKLDKLIKKNVLPTPNAPISTPSPMYGTELDGATKLKILLAGALCLVCMFYVGNFFSSFFASDISQEQGLAIQGPMTVLCCTKCGECLSKRCKDISRERCPKCSASMLQAMKCRDCGKTFPAKDDFYDETGRLKCPFCESGNTSSSIE